MGDAGRQADSRQVSEMRAEFEHFALPVARTLAKLDVPRSRFYR